MRRNKTIAIVAAALMLGSCSEASEKNETSAAEESTAETTAVTSKADDSSKPDDVTATEEEDTLYDWTPISKAYLAGDPSGLDDIQAQVYSKASMIIDDIIDEDMDDYEKELAIHDYIVQNVTYDINMLGIFEKHGEHAADPYGALFDGRCICSGYTTTFNMFMDMLEIPCTSVLAAADDNEAHAWNMVQINGHWYYMDVTWDDPIPDKEGRLEQHKYFNTSKEIMADRHIWDSTNDPVCDTDEDSYAAHELYEVSSSKDILNVMKLAVEKRTMNVYIIPKDPEGWSLDEVDGSDDYLTAGLIGGDMLKEAQKAFTDEYGSHIIQWQRMKIGDKIAVAGYMLKF